MPNKIKTPDEIIVEAERKMISANHDLKLIELIELIQLWEKFTEGGALSERTNDTKSVHMLYTRFASIILHWLFFHEHNITTGLFNKLCALRTSIANIFFSSGFRNTNCFLSAARRSEDNPFNFNVRISKLPILLATMSIDDIPAQLLSLAIKQDPDTFQTFFLSVLNARSVLTQKGELNRTFLLSNSALLKRSKLLKHNRIPAIRLWMYCTYSEYEGKHDVKFFLNELFVSFLLDSGLKKPSVLKSIKRVKPTILVINERFTSNHAMFRCYSRAIKSLRVKFEVIGLTDINEIDENSSAIFDRSITFDPDKIPFQAVVDIIEKLSPDVIFYPSIGMHGTTIFLSNFRFAPIQIMSLGHPATSRSREMDYVFAGGYDNSIKNCFSERLLTDDSWRFSDVPYMSTEELKIFRSQKDMHNRSDVLRVGINSKVLKLSYRLLDICKKLEQNISQKIEFHFFPGEGNLGLDALRVRLSDFLSNVTVHSTYPYKTLLEKISLCDVCLAAFPFGNSNSTVDCFIAGTPVVAHFGVEPSSRTDRINFQLLNAPLELIADNDADYYNIAFRLLTDSEYRYEIISKICKIPIFSELEKNAASKASSQNISEIFYSLLEKN